MSSRTTTINRGAVHAPWVSANACALVVMFTSPAMNATAQQSADSPKYYGVQSCVQCHRSPVDNVFAKPSDDFIQLNEFATWHEQDKHTLAYCVLEGELGQRMQRLLRYDDVTRDARCTNCHAPLIDKPHMNGTLRAADGVGCETCHGPAERWYGPHQFPSWRDLSAERKSDSHMADLDDPVKRSRLCVSCHVGDPNLNRVVTHDMYAAGHPPLPSVEIGAYSEQMPRHWLYPDEKSEKRDADGKRDFTRTKIVLAGGPVALAASLQLIADGSAGEDGWPELARFDCMACHHDLKYPSWRQERGYRGRPGRPTPRLAPLALVQVGSKLAGQADGELERRLSPLVAAFDDQPFGDAAKVQEAARELILWTNALAGTLSEIDLDERLAREAMRDLCTIAAADLPDYDSARQIAWALETIYQDVHPDRMDWDSRAAGVFEQLDEQLWLTFPKRQPVAVATIRAGDQDPRCAEVLTNGPITAALPESLRAAAAYDAHQFQCTLADFAALLAPP